LLATEDVEDGCGQMPCHGAHRPTVPFAPPRAKGELADMPVGASGVAHSQGVGGLGEPPLQIAVDVGLRASVAHTVADGRSRAFIFSS
jgi:hypothetical protein